jgi:hypothetical protein
MLNFLPAPLLGIIAFLLLVLNVCSGCPSCCCSPWCG